MSALCPPWIGREHSACASHVPLPLGGEEHDWRRMNAIVLRNDARSLMTGTRDGAIARAEQYFDDGGFLAELQRRVAIPTTSQEQGSMPALQEYVSGEMTRS